MSSDDWQKVAIGFVVAVTWVLDRLNNRKGHKEIRAQLAECERKNDDKDGRINKLRIRLSALETEMVALRNLLPGGKWYDTVNAKVEGHGTRVALEPKDKAEGG